MALFYQAIGRRVNGNTFPAFQILATLQLQSAGRSVRGSNHRTCYSGAATLHVVKSTARRLAFNRVHTPQRAFCATALVPVHQVKSGYVGKVIDIHRDERRPMGEGLRRDHPVKHLAP